MKEDVYLIESLGDYVGAELDGQLVLIAFATEQSANAYIATKASREGRPESIYHAVQFQPTGKIIEGGIKDDATRDQQSPEGERSGL